jgi:hypothetical protein
MARLPVDQAVAHDQDAGVDERARAAARAVAREAHVLQRHRVEAPGVDAAVAAADRDAEIVEVRAGRSCCCSESPGCGELLRVPSPLSTLPSMIVASRPAPTRFTCTFMRMLPS